MADNSEEKASVKGFFLSRSLLWKVLFIFLLLGILFTFQFIIIFGSITNIGNVSDDTFRVIEQRNGENRVQTDIISEVTLLDSQLQFVKNLYLGYILGTSTSAANQFAGEIQSIQAKTFFVTSKINSISNEEFDPEFAQSLFGEVDRDIDGFLSNAELIFDNLPSFVRVSIDQAFSNFSRTVSFKVTNLLEWMYSNNDPLLLEIVEAESVANSSFALRINNTIAPVSGINPLLAGQLTSLSLQINNAYVDLLPHVQEIITEVSNVSFNPDNFNQTAMKHHIDEVTTITSQINSLSQNITEIMSIQDTNVNALILTTDTTFGEISSKMEEIIDWSTTNQDFIERRLNEVQEDSSSRIDELITNITTVLIVIFTFSIIIVLALVMLSNYQVTKPIKHISYWSEKISDGDLSYNVYKSDRTDEIGVLHNNFRTMNKNLKDIIIEVKESSAIISVTADDLSSNTQEINATAEEVSAIAQSMAKGSTQQAELISTIVEELQITSEIVDGVINQINYNLRIIHELSEQTNVLALNTAIEAANAGEFGRGFAVISESIRKMASQSKKTTEEVTKDSRDVLLQLQTTFSNITRKIENVAAVSEETAASAEEVAASAEELTSVMDTVSAKSALLNERSSQSASLVSHFILERKESEIKMTIIEENGNGEESAKLDE